MKKFLLSSFIVLWSCVLLAQNDYQKGYYINGQGNRIDGYIKLIDYNIINDAGFSGLDFKANEIDKPEKIQMQNVNEFGFDNQLKIVKTSVEMDDVNLIKNFDNQRDLNFKNETAFLKVLFEGNPSLYLFPSENGTKYFMKGENDKSPVQLVYKKYVAEEGFVKENNKFREQLFKAVKTDDQVFNDFLNIKYEVKDLIPFFENYNKSKNIPFQKYPEKFGKSVKLNLTAYAGLNAAFFGMKNTNPATETNIGTAYDFGGEAELMLPSEKWSFLAKVEYCSTKMNTTAEGQNGDPYDPATYKDKWNLNVKYIDFVFGTRWYNSFANGSKLFAGAGIGLVFPSGTLTWDRIVTHSAYINNYPTVKYDLSKQAMYLNFEIGYKFDKHYGLGLNIDTSKNFLERVGTIYSTKFITSGLNFRYTF